MVNFPENYKQISEESTKRFLTEKIGTDQSNYLYIKKYIEDTQKFEEKYKKSLFNWNTKQILNYYKWIGTSSVQLLVLYNTTFSRYAQWAIENNLVVDAQNHFDMISREALINCINKNALDNKIITKAELDKCLKELNNPSDKFILLAIFEGIKGNSLEDIVFFKLSSIDKENKTAKLRSGRTVELSDELIKYAEESEQEYDYVSLTPNLTVLKLKEEPDRVIKPKGNSHNGKMRIAVRIKFICNFLGLPDNINATALFESGRIDYINRRSRELNISPEEYIHKYRKEVEERFNSKIQSLDLYLQKYEDFLNKD